MEGTKKANEQQIAQIGAQIYQLEKQLSVLKHQEKTLEMQMMKQIGFEEGVFQKNLNIQESIEKAKKTNKKGKKDAKSTSKRRGKDSPEIPVA